MQVVSSRIARVRCLSPRIGLVLTIAVALGAGGCAESRSRYGEANYVRAVPPQVAQAEPVELEDDGLPAQVAPPLRRNRPEADDPSQPWSPNYGNPGAQRRADVSSAPLRR